MYFRVKERARRRQRRWRPGLVVPLAVAAAAAAAASVGERPARRTVPGTCGPRYPGFQSAPAGGPLRAPRALSEACPAVRGLRCSGPGLTGGGSLLQALEASRRGRATRGLQAGSRAARRPPPRPVAPAPCAVALPALRAECDPLLTRLQLLVLFAFIVFVCVSTGPCGCWDGLPLLNSRSLHSSLSGVGIGLPVFTDK